MQTQSIVRLTPTGTTTLYSFAHRQIAGITGFLPNGLAVAPNGTIYTDTDGANGWATAGSNRRPPSKPPLQRALGTLARTEHGDVLQFANTP
jgi:hypothetical protein